MSNFVSFLERLNLREKILFMVLLGFLGIFAGFKFYENFLNQFVEEIVGLNYESLREKKAQINALMTAENRLKIEIDGQNLKLDSYKKQIAFFNQNYESYLDFIELLSKKHHLLVHQVRNSYEDANLFQKHHLNLELSGEFSNLLLFIYELENSDFMLMFENIEFQNEKGLSLSLRLDLKFVSLK